jgi:hypothetical protein
VEARKPRVQERANDSSASGIAAQTLLRARKTFLVEAKKPVPECKSVSELRRLFWRRATLGEFNGRFAECNVRLLEGGKE